MRAGWRVLSGLLLALQAAVGAFGPLADASLHRERGEPPPGVRRTAADPGPLHFEKFCQLCRVAREGGAPPRAWAPGHVTPLSGDPGLPPPRVPAARIPRGAPLGARAPPALA